MPHSSERLPPQGGIAHEAQRCKLASCVGGPRSTAKPTAVHLKGSWSGCRHLRTLRIQGAKSEVMTKREGFDANHLRVREIPVKGVNAPYRQAAKGKKL